MRRRLVSVCLMAACQPTTVEPAEMPMSAGATSGPEATSAVMSDGGVAPSDCGSFATEETCAAPCSWLTHRTIANAAVSCDPGDDVSFCAYVSSDTPAGCGGQEPCVEPWGYIELPEGPLAISKICGGTPPEGWTQCVLEDYQGGIPECACMCPEAQQESTTGGGTSTSTGT